MNNRNKNILLGILIVGVISITIAFAALNTTLTINGTVNIPEAKWDIHFENWTLYKPQTNLAGVTNKASQISSGVMTPSTKGTLISEFEVRLEQPGDIIGYDFDIVNDGTINASLSDFKTKMSAKIAPDNIEDASTNNLTYTVVCGEQAPKGSQTLGDNPAIPVKEIDTLDAGYAIACKLTISYNVQTNNQTPGENQTYNEPAKTITVEADWVWVQGNASVSTPVDPTPQTPVDPTEGFDKFYTPTQKSGGPTLPSGSQFWIQEIESTGERKVCGVFANGTVCMENSSSSSEFGTKDSNNQWQVTGYTLQKKNEMINAGATSCVVYSDQLRCYGPDGMYALMQRIGGAKFFTSGGTHRCGIDYDDGFSCY